MKQEIKIGLVGDFNPAVRAHNAIPRALDMINDESFLATFTWLPTPVLEENYKELLSKYDGIWLTPASPYESMTGALNSVKYVRENNIPFLGTCGGFQHLLVEYARNVLGLNRADHQESNPDAEMPVISGLACSLEGKIGKVQFKAGSKIAAIYNALEAEEEFRCNFGVNPNFRHLFDDRNISITGIDPDNEVRVVEHLTHPFFIGTLYQPELAALNNRLHPLILAFTKAAFEFRYKGIRYMA
jgi:CTP synthase (UTP-ammonia lyase)